MRTTLTLEPDALEAAKAKAAQERMTLGKAVSELILQAIRQTQREQGASAVVRSPGGLYTTEQVEAALDDEQGSA